VRRRTLNPLFLLRRVFRGKLFRRAGAVTFPRLQKDFPICLRRLRDPFFERDGLFAVPHTLTSEMEFFRGEFLISTACLPSTLPPTSLFRRSPLQFSPYLPSFSDHPSPCRRLGLPRQYPACGVVCSMGFFFFEKSQKQISPVRKFLNSLQPASSAPPRLCPRFNGLRDSITVRPFVAPLSPLSYFSPGLTRRHDLYRRVSPFTQVLSERLFPSLFSDLP